MNPEPLRHARALARPTREATLRRDRTVHAFWDDHAPLLREAWREWEAREQDHLPRLDDTLFHPALRDAVNAAWDDPAREDAVRALWTPAGTGVMQCSFFDPARLGDLRAYLDASEASGIPLRAPYGIVLNRRGAMLDPRSVGYLAGPHFQQFYRRLVDHYFRPISRLLFPEVTGYDGQSFGFSIAYQPSTDTSIRPHTDASTMTLNLNLNLPDEDFSGSVVDFYDPDTGRPHPFVFAPGVAALHRGHVAHAARPITEGSRTNLVLWLYGDHGQIPRRGAPAVPWTARERWTVPTDAADGFAPF